jgi:hypothetical protein
LSSTWTPFGGSSSPSSPTKALPKSSGRPSIDDGAMFALPAFFQDEVPASPAPGGAAWLTSSDAPLFDGIASSTAALLDDDGDEVAPWDKWSMGLTSAATRSATASPVERAGGKTSSDAAASYNLFDSSGGSGGGSGGGVGGGGGDGASSKDEKDQAYNLFSSHGGLFGSFGSVFGGGARGAAGADEQQRK